jgi:tetratricopeptide (TPR) repeat protein
MKLSLLILLLVSFTTYAADDMVQFQPQSNNTVNQSLLEQQQKNSVDLAVIKLKQAAQRKEIDATSQTLRQQGQNVTDLKLQLVNTDAKLNIQDLRKELLDRQENKIDSWLTVVAIFITVFGLLVPAGAWLFNRKMNQKINEIEKLKQQAQQHVDDISKLRDLSAEKYNDDPQQAANLIQSIDETSSKLDQMMATAYRFQENKQIENAIKQWREILGVANYSDDRQLQEKSYFNLGYLLDEVEDYEQAITAYQQAIALNPEHSKAYNNMGISYGKSGKYQQAITAYEQAIALNPEYSEAYYNMGISYANLGKYEQAITAYQQAIALNPEYSDAYNNMGNSYAKSGKYQQAITAYEQAIALNPELSEAYNNMGSSYDDLKDYKQAITAYKQAIALNPEDSEAKKNLELALILSNNVSDD